jgi:hypothetical protein
MSGATCGDRYLSTCINDRPLPDVASLIRATSYQPQGFSQSAMPNAFA